MGENRKCNVWCEHYGKCLDEAVKSGNRFNCAGCSFEFNQGGKDGVADMLSYYLLVAAIFYPKEYKVYCDATKQAKNAHALGMR